MASSTVAPEEAKVIVSDPAAVVIVTFDPAAKVRVSVVESATTSVCPDTAMVLKHSVAIDAEVPVNVNFPVSVVNTSSAAAPFVNTTEVPFVAV